MCSLSELNYGRQVIEFLDETADGEFTVETSF